MATLTDLARDTRAADRAGRLNSTRAVGTGWVLEVWHSPYGHPTHTHYRADGSRYAPRFCGCWSR